MRPGSSESNKSDKSNPNPGTHGRYATAKAFRTALEERLKQQSRRERIDLQRLRRRVAFERFLARMFAGDDPLWVLKGGYSLELRLHDTARATIDIDLAVPLPNRALPKGTDQLRVVRERLQISAERDLGDWFVFAIAPSAAGLQGPPEGGMRFSVQAHLDNRLFAQFHVDVGVGDVLLSEPEWITGHPLLEFAGIPPIRIAALPLEQHFAEKVHAYTLPRPEATNTRIKDLIDLVLLIDLGPPNKAGVARALRATFERRNTHDIPLIFPSPPDSWRERYAALAAECGVSAQIVQDAYPIVSTYWDSLVMEPPA